MWWRRTHVVACRRARVLWLPAGGGLLGDTAPSLDALATDLADPQCQRAQTVQTVEHALLHCPALAAARQRAWTHAGAGSAAVKAAEALTSRSVFPLSHRPSAALASHCCFSSFARVPHFSLCQLPAAYACSPLSLSQCSVLTYPLGAGAALVLSSHSERSSH